MQAQAQAIEVSGKATILPVAGGSVYLPDVTERAMLFAHNGKCSHLSFKSGYCLLVTSYNYY